MNECAQALTHAKIASIYYRTQSCNTPALEERRHNCDAAAVTDTQRVKLRFAPSELWNLDMTNFAKPKFEKAAEKRFMGTVFPMFIVPESLHQNKSLFVGPHWDPRTLHISNTGITPLWGHRI